MEREIKFRAFVTSIEDGKKKMFLPFDLNWLKRDSDAPPHFTHATDDRALWDKDAIFMQYTGRKDKNGKEVWEKDKIITFNHSKVKFVSFVEFHRGSFGIWGNQSEFCNLSEFEEEDIENIGNKFENPELNIDNHK